MKFSTIYKALNLVIFIFVMFVGLNILGLPIFLGWLLGLPLYIALKKDGQTKLVLIACIINIVLASLCGFYFINGFLSLIPPAQSLANAFYPLYFVLLFYAWLGFLVNTIILFMHFGKWREIGLILAISILPLYAFISQIYSSMSSFGF